MASVSSVSSSSSLEGLISQYMAIERQPLTNLQTRRSEVSAKTSYYDTLKTRLTTLQDLAEQLKETESDSIFNSVNVSSNKTDIVSVSAESGASVGTYTLRVRQLATSTQLKSTASLNTTIAAKSSTQVVAGVDELDIFKSFSEAGFSATPSGSVSINGKTFSLDEYDTVSDFIIAVNNDETAAANIYYDENIDKFIIENDDHNQASLVISQIAGESGTGFLGAVNIATGTYGAEPNMTPSATGVQGNVLLYKANFDNALGETETGSFKINGVTFNWNAAEDTLNELISDINTSTANVTVFYDESLDKIMITANDTGSEEIQYEDVEGNFLSDTLKLDGAVQTVGNDAKFTINSADASDEITKASNNFEINGLSITLKNTTVTNDNYSDPETESVVISSTKNNSIIKNKIQSFLDSFNNATLYIKNLSDVNISTYSRGVFTGETVFRNLRFELIDALTRTVTGGETGDPTSLAEIGITFDENLKAKISDSSQLEEFLSNDPKAVANLFNGSDGVATHLYDFLESYVQTDGIIDSRKTSISDQLETMDSSIKRMEERMTVIETNYRSKLQSMQTLLYQIVQQQNTVNSILSATNS
ncbi:MAG TPA: flagellar filament capping protein FliD [bacterium]|nr:flagellar filament capping protein FliD [bacterium]HPN43233.1 flagellar filament capping protein FliD [bacterium]